MTPKKICICPLAFLVACGAFAKAWTTLEARYKEASLTEEYDIAKAQGRGYYIPHRRGHRRRPLARRGPQQLVLLGQQRIRPQARLAFRSLHRHRTLAQRCRPARPQQSGCRPGRARAQSRRAHRRRTGHSRSLHLFTTAGCAGFRWARFFCETLFGSRCSGWGSAFSSACWGIFLQSLTEWVYRQTPIFFTFNIILGALASLYFSNASANEGKSNLRMRTRTTPGRTVKCSPANRG